MADRIFFDVQALQPNAKIIAGSFTTAGSSDPSVTTGKGFTVAHSATGTYTITLDDKYPGLLAATATLQSSSSSDSVVQLGDIDVTSAKTLVVRTLTAGSDADLTGPIVHFNLVLRNTSVS